ncbi:malto-oligosyltrehalose synthase [Williamsia sp. CHRR-6]|uniref:malto-oligosyltrehalose synthase n=1 Tax=Williamsia sp. CHRR-6 TaxID=2835871 RepID=UPI001BDA9791|nr:malto-oligosyltrehalose synthase [Williamsia sp. CHRR-6]MBT0565230.1 malto-oligosyltrehalose synthase [Williamsia sp. CHRR-6]
MRPIHATYRVQLHAGFTFADATAILPHLQRLGVSHLYLSPIGTAMGGSTHGYDWIPPVEVAAVLGGIEGLRALRTAGRDHDIGLIVDIVPNHTGIDDPRQNIWWWDVLGNGEASPYADYFDIDWAPDNGADGAIALPVLGSADDLAALSFAEGPNGTTELAFYDHRFPLAAGTDTSDPIRAHDAQHYRLVPWDSGVIGYRRFFAVNGLAALRQEDPRVYDATHIMLRRLIAEDLIDGVRVDHPDGLTDPVGYLTRLRADIGPDRLLWIEKVLAVEEDLDPALPVDGTTGYDALRVLDGVFVDSDAESAFGEVHRQWTGNDGGATWLAEHEHQAKLQTLAEMFPAERARLIRSVLQAARDDGHLDPAGVHLGDLTEAVGQVVATLGVYRADYPSLRARLDTTIAQVGDRMPGLRPALRMIARAVGDEGEASQRLAQVGGATTAKSVEDYLFYRTARLVSLQEVGGDPGRFGVEVAEFHAFNVARSRDWPSAMTTLSTHDTKRGEDVRSRIALLTHHPDRWRSLTDTLRTATDAGVLGEIEGTTALLLLQNMIGVWPAQGGVDAPRRRRLHDYATKAAREAGIITAWTAVDAAAEAAMHAWIDAVIDGPVGAEVSRLVTDLGPEIERTSVAHKVLSLLVPGVPDVYQGTEWFEDSLVDPDNRRPVDVSASPEVKTSAVRTALSVRRAHPESFGAADSYRPLAARGRQAHRVIAFLRGTDVVVITSCLPTLDPDDDTAVDLPPGRWRLVGATDHPELSGSAQVSTVLCDRAVALLETITPNP